MTSFLDPELLAQELNNEREKCQKLQGELSIARDEIMKYQMLVLELRKNYGVAHILAEAEEEALVNKVTTIFFVFITH